MTAAFSLDAIAQLSAAQIVDCLIEGTLIAIFASLLLRVTHRQNSGTRFAVLFSALITIAALPLIGFAWPSHSVILPAATINRPAITLPASWALYLVWTWSAIASWFLAGIVRGLLHLRALRRSCVPVDPAKLDPRLQEVLEQNQMRRPVTLCTSDRVQVPTAIGLTAPMVVLPRWVMQELSADELHQIVLHEMAHLRRWDDWTNLAQKLVKAIFFFHPAIWWLEKRVSLEREMACDEAVVAATARPRAYAECLAHLAEKTLIQRSVALAQAALGRIRHTSIRVAQILNANPPAERRLAWKPAASLVAAFAIVAAVAVSKAPRLVAFQESFPPSTLGRTIARQSPFPSSAVGIVNTRATNAVLHLAPVRSVQPKLNLGGTPRASQPSERAAEKQNPRSQTQAYDAIRLPDATVVPVAFTETMFVVVESAPGSDRPVYQIQMWRVTVFHPVVDPTNRIPRKET